MDWVVEGTVLADKYRLERKLGQGGMGAVWRAEHVQLRSPVAIKLIDAQIVAHPDALARFLREAQSAAALRSPHVVQILDFGADRGVPYIAMELLEGESLADRIARVGRMSPMEVARLMTQVARALGKAHEMGIVHRDIKPDNIFLVRNDEEEVAKVLDFGIAKSAAHGLGPGSGSTTRTGAILGTPNYMSPEQAEGTKLVDHRTDLWALGVIGFEALVGRKPFDSDALGSLLLAICTRPIPVPSQWGFHLPGFDQWFARACARELHERHQNARDLAAELRQICGVIDTRDPSPSLQSGQLRPVTRGTLTTPYNAAGPPTGNTYGTSVTANTKRRSPVLAISLVLGVVALVAAGGVALVVRKSRVDAAAEASAASPVTATQAPAPMAEKPAATATSTAPTLSPVAPAASAAEVTTAPSVTPAAPAAARPAAATRTRPLPAKKSPIPAARTATPSPATAPPPPPPPPEPKAEPKPSNKINLGI